jgi:curved DNA-binding protein CbpA
MSELDCALKLFDFLNINDITTDSLKSSFKKKVLKFHPDKGGNALEFDNMLAAFLYLSDTFNRINGGRATLQNITTPDKLKELRPDELINRIFEEFDNNTFNVLFEQEHLKILHGYTSWLKDNSEETLLIDGKYGTATQLPPTIDIQDLNKTFEKTVKQNKQEPISIIIHPEAIAHISGSFIGTDIIETPEKDYTSNIFTNPNYTDVFSAFTTTNTIYDKVNIFIETNKTLDDLIKERNSIITPFDDNELKAIQNFEEIKLQQTMHNLSNIKDYFKYDSKSGQQLENWPPEKYPIESYKGFVIDL